MVFPLRKWSVEKKKDFLYWLLLYPPWEELCPLPEATAVGLLAAIEQQQLLGEPQGWQRSTPSC